MNFYKFFTLSLIFFTSFYSIAKKNNNETYNVEIIVFEQLEIIGNEQLESKKLNKDYFAQNGELLLKVIPDTLLEAKVFIPNSQIGLLNTNMRVDFIVSAYPLTRFAYINIVATLINFIFLAFVIGPDEIGYNESFGSLLGLVGLAQGLSFLGIIRLSGKLFNAKDNPLLAGAVAVTYGVSIVGLMFSLTPTFIANGFNVRGISADTVTDLSFYLNFTQFLFCLLYTSDAADE